MKLRRSRNAFASIVLAVGVVIAGAQEPAAEPAEKVSQPEVGGKFSYELIRLKEGRLSVPLRYGAVKAGSEKIDLNGKVLVRDRDYRIDYNSGTIIITIQHRTGDALRVSYRYSPEQGEKGTYGSQVGSTGTGNFGGFTFELTPGTSAYIGMGMTERMGNGNTYSSDIYGLMNNFSIGGGFNLQGGWFTGSRTRSESMSLFDGDTGQRDDNEGAGRALVQSLSGNLFGGKVSAYYQDIDERFAGFSAFSGGQYDVNQLQREKGLKRSMFALDKIGSQSFNLSSSFTSVGDSDGMIESNSYGLNAGSLSMNWWSQTVDTGFTRFKDIADANEAKQLQKERGLERQGLTASMMLFGGKSSYASSMVEDLDGSGVRRQSLQYELPWLKLDYADQQVDENFGRAGDLRSDWDPKQMSNERGLSRTSFGLSTDKLMGGPLSFRSSVVSSKDGDFRASDFSASNARWGFQYIRRQVDEGFGRIGNLTGDEINQHSAAALRATTGDDKVNGHDRNAFIGGSGIDREAMRANFDDGKGTKVSAHNVDIQGTKGGLQETGLSVESGKLSASFNQQNTSDDFSDISRLMQTEQKRFGTSIGLDKTDLTLNWKDKNSGFSYDTMRVNDPTGKALREKIKIDQKNFNLEVNHRSVSEGFTTANSLVDSEREILRRMIGEDVTEAQLNMSLLPGMAISTKYQQSSNKMLGEDGETAYTTLKWDLDKLTKIQGANTQHKEQNGEEALSDISLDNVSVTRDLGKLGKVTLLRDTKTFAGSEDNERDSKTNALIYETKLNDKTSLRTEQSRTNYDTGEKEVATSNTLSTELSKNLGVSVTQTQINRDGEAPDEEFRNFGFWYDFGQGIKLEYGYVRKTQDEVGTSGTTAKISGGEVGGVKFGGANYQHNGWDSQRDKHVGGLSLQSAKPLNFGDIRDFQFYYNLSTDRDYGLWKKEDKSMGFSAAYKSIDFGFNYQSQVDNNGERAIDRFFNLTTDKTGKDPVRASLTYGIRTMPSDEQVIIRNYEFVYKPSGNFNLEHRVSTNPLKDVPKALLGSSVTPTSRNEWALNWTGNKSTHAGLYWKEDTDERRDFLAREAGISVTLFADNPSPLRLTYGLIQKDLAGVRDTRHTFGLLFNQQAGPNQSFSVMAQNLNWTDGRPENISNNWQFRLDYSVRF